MRLVEDDPCQLNLSLKEEEEMFIPWEHRSKHGEPRVEL
jgi:hypothetical protein